MTEHRIRLAAALPLALLALSSLLAAGCATVRPWDRDLLSEKQMSFVPSNPEHDVDDHVYFSKEGSSGGQNVGGGGCGCN
jgi:predicted small secreted protein